MSNQDREREAALRFHRGSSNPTRWHYYVPGEWSRDTLSDLEGLGHIKRVREDWNDIWVSLTPAGLQWLSGREDEARVDEALDDGIVSLRDRAAFDRLLDRLQAPTEQQQEPKVVSADEVLGIFEGFEVIEDTEPPTEQNREDAAVLRALTGPESKYISWQDQCAALARAADALDPQED